MTTATLTFEGLCAMEPRLRDLERAAKAERAGHTSLPVDEWVWVSFKRRAAALVGFQRRDVADMDENHPLRGDAAYVIVINHMAALLGV